MTGLQGAVQAEIEDLHIFFIEWFSGACAKDDAVFDRRVTDRMADDLVLIPPGGNAIDKKIICDAVRGGYGLSPDFRIVIRNVELRPVKLAGHVLAIYEEWQRGAVNSTPPDNGRVASVLFKLDDQGRPEKWLHIHETWLPEARYTNEAFDF